MATQRPTPFDPTLLRATADLRRLGEDPGARDADGAATWARVRHGVVVGAPEWKRSTPEQRHAALVHATAMHVRGDTIPTFSHAAAAAVWRLPRVSAWPARVDVLTTKARRSSDTMRRHLGQPGMVETVDGLPVTSLTRTLIDIARTEDLKDAVAAMDHALHHALCTREQLRAELDLVPAGARGRAQAELAVSLADPGAMSVGESLSRVQMFRFNLPRPQLQVRIEDADGLAGVCDFGWVGLGTLGEFDGRKKYGLDGLEGDRVAEVMWREKKREDRIRARGHRMARWVWADAADGSRMVRILAAQGVRPTRRNTWLDAA